MPKRPLPKPPRFEKVPPLVEPPQMDPPDEVKRPPRIDRTDQRVGKRPKMDDSLRGQPGGEFISPYLHNLRRDPSRQRREDQEQLDVMRKLQEEKHRIDEEIRKVREEEGGVNPYNLQKDVNNTFDRMVSDLRNMEQAPWSGNLSGYYGYSPLHNLFEDQFGVSETDDDPLSS